MKNLIVDIYLRYLKFFAYLQLKKINPIVVGIGGANGKSSLTHITNLILEESFNVKQSGGKNSETGIPLNILNIDIEDYSYKSWILAAVIAPIRILFDWDKYDIYLVEMGIDSPNPPKNMEYLLSFIKPNISVLTNIQIEHTKYFDEISDSENEKIRRSELLNKISDQEKLLLKKLDSKGRAIVNLDDELILKSLPLNAKTLTISKKEKNADFYIEKITFEEDKFRTKFKFLKENYEVVIGQILPEYYSFSIVSAIAIAFSNEISIVDSIDIIEEKFSLPPGRFSVFKGIKNTTLFDSSYNSSLEASIGAIKAVGGIKINKRKVGIFGNMNELGSISKLQHESLAKEITRHLDYAIVIGDEINNYAIPIFEKENFAFDSFENYTSFKTNIIQLIKKDDLVLIKASQNGMLFERIVEDLLLDKKYREKLCRRGKYWDNIRKNTK